MENHFFKEISEFAPIGIFHAQMNGNIIMANPELAWMLGHESADQVIKHISNFATQVICPPQQAKKFMFSLLEADEVNRFRCTLRKKDHSRLWSLCYAKLVRNASGKPIGFNGYAIDISETVRAETALKKANTALKRLASLDGLTQIANRRRFDEVLETEWKRHTRDQTPLSLILCDIDYFKRYNDTYGHQAGDFCLQKVAACIQNCINRPGDLAARYGGEEFGIILPSTPAMGCIAIANKILTAVRNLDIEHKDSIVCPCVTISLGIASLIPDTGYPMAEFLKTADKALYSAKEKGRNQCALHDLSLDHRKNKY